MIKLIRFLQTPIRIIGIASYLIKVAYLEGREEGFKYLASKYHDEHFK